MKTENLLATTAWGAILLLTMSPAKAELRQSISGSIDGLLPLMQGVSDDASTIVILGGAVITLIGVGAKFGAKRRR